MLAAAIALAAPSAAALAQEKDYPNRVIKFVVPFATGSGGDTSGRFFGEQLARVIGQPVVVENRPGGSGSLGAVSVKNAPPDGYTVLVAGWSAQTVNPIVVSDLPYDPIKDFRPISGLTRSMTSIVVSGSSSIKTLADLVAAAKAAKQPLNVGTISVGQQIVLEWLASLTGVKFANVPYKSGSQMLVDLSSGQIDAAIEGLTTAGPVIHAGKVRAVAVAGEARHAQFPDVPTVKESGFPEFINYGWSALYVRADTPDAIVKLLADGMSKALANPASREFVLKNGNELMPLGPVEMRQFEESQLTRFRSVAEKAGIGKSSMR
ncbi:MAG: tripartite tricarboxylate transporter substrate binding protein [Burkholderiales bacterium]|nr:tripartite tricarboxylate transporter substrate binding protein [Burkholderiales bacterium]